MRCSMLAVISALAAFPAAAMAQNAAQMKALQGLAPFSALLDTPAGKDALAANLAVTGQVQNGTARQKWLQKDFAGAQAQALKDATITAGNGWELADGLGSKLGGAYQALTTVEKPKPGEFLTQTTNISPGIANLLAYSFTLSGADASAAKYFFSNGTVVTKTASMPAPPDEAAIMTAVKGETDVFGKAYGLPAGAAGADPLGDSRPFQTEKQMAKYSAPDFFGAPASNQDYLTGPVQNLVKSPSFPSGHTTYGYTEALLFAEMVPERFPQMIVRGAEYGNSRIIVGAHYAMDVIGGRTLAMYDVAHLLAGDAAYVGQKEGKAEPIADFGGALASAKAELRAALVKACGASIRVCAMEDTGRFAEPAANLAFYDSTQTYGLPVVYPAQEGKAEDVGKLAPEAGYLLTTAFPKLSLEQADQILTETEGPGGGFLDDGSGFGVYSRLDLVRAGLKAQVVK